MVLYVLNEKMGSALFQEGEHEQLRRGRCLIVERKLLRNRGHHHTQIAAIEELFSGYEILLLTGQSYDGFLSYPARSVTADVGRDGRRARRNAHGPLPRRLARTLVRILSGRPSHHSRFGVEFSEAIAGFGLGDIDAVVIPSATLDDLSAVVEAYGRLGPGRSPQCYIRFLDPGLGEPSVRLREADMAALLRELPREVHLYCETEEMADYMSGRFGHPFAGGFYLPCTLDPRMEWEKPQSPNDAFRVGVFGMPRKEKGATRIGAIIDAIGEIEQPRTIEFVIQGREIDFQPQGLYAAVAAGNSKVRVTRLIGALEPDEFRRNLLLADAILLPYDASLYCLQGSGLVQDAVAALRPIVHSRGFSMHDLLQHGNALDAETDKDFAGAIIRLAASADAFSAGCRKAREVFRWRLDQPVLFQAADRS